MSEQSEWIVDGTVENFQQVVVDGSMDRLIVIDFWAEWCGPCKQLAPILEKLAVDYAGKFMLVKVDTEAQQQLAAAFGVQSIPFVVAFLNGQPVSQFAGVKPEEEIKEWLKPLLPSPVDLLYDEGQKLEVVDPLNALQKLQEALELEPEHAPSKILMARILTEQNRLDEARKQLESLQARGYLEPEAQQILSQLEVREAAGEAGDVTQAREAAAADPENVELQLQLADTLAVAGKFEEAFQICLDWVEKDKYGENATQAKETMVKLFDMAGPSSELVSTYRRKLATMLY